MNGVEAAASLFGSEEPASDPFASLGETPPTSSTDNLFNVDGDAPSDLDFLSASQDDRLLDTASVNTAQYYAQTEPAYAHSIDSTGTPLSTSNVGQEGWYDQQVPGQAYEPQQSYSAPAYGVPSQQPKETTTGLYDPYAPAFNVHAPPPSQHTYDPYAPVQQTNSYLPQQATAPAATAYSQYTPTQSQVYASQYTPSYTGTSQVSYTPAPQVEHLPPPKLTASGVVQPPAATTVTRPKISNAYDPPFPTTSKNRKTARTGSGQNAYGYNAYESPSAPAYGFPAQPSPYLSQQTPPSQATPPPPPHRLPPPPLPQDTPPPPPQRLPPPPLPQGTPPPPQRLPQHQLPSQSLPPPPARSPVSPVQPPHSSSTTYPVQSEYSDNTDGASYPSYGMNYSERTSEPVDPESMSQNEWNWNQEPYSGEMAPSLNGQETFDHDPSPEKDPEAFDTNLLDESQINPLDIPSAAGVPPRPSDSQLNGTNPLSRPPVSLATAIRSDSPRLHALPPSPTLSHRQGRSSPFAEPNLVTTKRTASPKSFVEPPMREKIPETDPYAPPRDAVHTSSSRSPVQTYSSPLRSSSPAAPYSNNIRSPAIGTTNPYLPKAVVGGERVTSPSNSLNGHSGGTTDPYAPKTYTSAYKGERIGSPSMYAARAVNGAPPSAKNYHTNPYAPPKPDARNRSASNSSMLSSASVTAEDPYAPPSRRISSDTDHGHYASRYQHPPIHEPNHYSSVAPEPTGIQELTVKPFQTPYAPSPSLMGANDPLGRTSARVPIFSFGFGGKLVTCFHGADSLSTGFDVALSARNSTGVHIRVLKKLIPESALDTSTAAFPGPLFGDSGTSTTSLVRTGVGAQTKTKKGKVIKYLAERTDELALGLRYTGPDTIESRQAEGKLVLVKLLQLMVEHDGRLTGTPELDAAVRLALVPRLEGTFGSNGFVAVADAPLPGFPSEPQESPISVTTLRPSTLDKIQDFLLRGERRQAYHLALDEKLWAHAMIISSSIDKEAWKEVVHEFLRTELGTPTIPHSANGPASSSSGRESLRVAYSLFSGQGAAAVQELAPQTLLARATGRPTAPVAPHLTPRTPNFAAISTQGASLPPQALSKWTETAAMMLSNPLTPENSSALTALGDQLAANQLLEAAHVCYLLAPQTSPLGGLGHPSARIVLVGSRNPQTWPSFAKDPDPLIFTEIAEFAFSLAPPVKGQEAFSGLAHLQAYRFIRAMTLAEIGDIQQANKYCDAITASVSRGSIYATPIFLEQLKGLGDRIAGVTQVDKSFWTGAKLSKPSLDSIGGWLEGRFTKLVTGDADLDKMPEEEVSIPNEGGFSGPFSHYSTISSNTPSERNSPQPSLVNLNMLPPPRSGSAMSSSTRQTNPHIDRASSAMDYARPKPAPPAPRIASANATTTSFAGTPSFGQALNSQRSVNGYSPSDDLVTPRPSLVTDDDESTVQEATWWGGTAYAEGPATATPTMSSFMRVDDGAIPASTSSEGFVSLMDNASYSIGPQTSSRTSAQASPTLDEEEDLGFGNTSKNQREAKREPSSEGSVSSSSSATPEPAKPAPPVEENRPPPSGWLSRWWKRSEAAPGPVRASLGEESAFYYDKDLKRWAGGAEATKAAAPPSRTQTASPGMSSTRPLAPTESGPPLNRSASAIDLSTSPPSRTTMRVRSNLVPMPESAPSTPTGTRGVPPSGPPPGRPRSQAAKRNIRNRYVDVFQQEGGA